MVFQDYALGPPLSVAENVGFPLEMRGVPRAGRDRRAAEAPARVGLAAFAARAPARSRAASSSRWRWPAP